MNHKIFNCVCLSIFLLTCIISPIKASAYQVSDQYINGPITNEEYQDLVTAGALTGILSSGKEIVIPDSVGFTDLLLDLFDFATHSEVGDAIWDYCTNPNGLRRDAQKIKYLLVGGNQDPTDMALMGLDVLFNTLGEDFVNNYVSDNDTIDVNPDVNYLPYIELINGSSNNYQYLQTDNWISSLYNKNHLSNEYFTNDPKNYTFINTSYASINKFNSSNYTSDYICYMYSNKYRTHQLYTSEILSLYVNQVNNQYQVTTSTIIPAKIFNFRDNEGYIFQLEYTPNNNFYELVSWGYQTTPPTIPNYSFTGTLEECFKSISMNFRNVNIYVDGVPWSLVTSPPEPIKIGGDTYITGTDVPINYQYPQGTWIDPAYLIHLLEEIDWNTKHTLTWEDIEDAFSDEYGNLAIYTIAIHRNDYDQLILEQYGSNRLTQNKGLLFPKNELQPYTETSSYITNSSINLIPNDILVVLGGCGILILIAYLINRLLE